ncbi:hypothetical protein LXL04_030654 [Taraxacum kok-saghyz]
MEDVIKGQSSVSGNKGGGSSAKLLRYPLRSGTKTKDDKPPLSATSTPSSSRRGKSSSVSQSVSALNLSAKDKSAKPPRRYFIPTKSSASPAPKPSNTTTPASDARTNRSRNIDGKNNTPVSEASRSLTRRKFSVLSSASYWLSQIKLSEAAGKHQVSLGFFNLAQVSACENLQLLKDELKSYTLRHNILDLGESAKEVLQSYDVLETMENVQVSEACCSHEQLQVSEDAISLSSVNETHKPKPKSSNISAKENNQKKLAPKAKPSTNKKTTAQQSVKTPKTLPKEITNKQKVNSKVKGKKPDSEVVVSSSIEEAITQENKENMDASLVEEISMES